MGMQEYDFKESDLQTKYEDGWYKPTSSEIRNLFLILFLSSGFILVSGAIFGLMGILGGIITVLIIWRIS